MLSFGTWGRSSMSSAATCRHAWACHCQPFGRDTSLRQIPAEDDVPAVWIVYMVTEREVKPSTAKAYTSGLRAIRVQLGCVCVPVRQSWAVHAAQQGCERRWDTPSKQLMPTEFAELLRMAEQVNPDSFNYTVVFTATDLAFFAFFGKDNVSLWHVPGCPICPVTLLRHVLDGSGLGEDTPRLFCTEDAKGRLKPLTHAVFMATFRKLAVRSGLHPTAYTGCLSARGGDSNLQAAGGRPPHPGPRGMGLELLKHLL
eukprot:gene14818-biopygen15267